nr:hypothetical protein [uncultured Fluviicola sp.]
MRFLKLLPVFLLISFQGLAQPQGKDSILVSRHRPGIFWYNTGWRPAKPGKLRKYDRLIIDLTYNQLVKSGSVRENPWRSFGCNINTMWDIPLIDGNTVSLGIGLAYKYQKTGPKGLFFADSSNSYTRYYADSSYLDYRKNTFGNHILAIPIEFRFRTPKWQHFKVHLGGSIGYRLQTFQKVWPEDKHKGIKDKALPGRNPLLYGVHMRIGIRNWALFADYTLAPQFKGGKSEQISALAFGVSLSIF